MNKKNVKEIFVHNIFESKTTLKQLLFSGKFFKKFVMNFFSLFVNLSINSGDLAEQTESSKLLNRLISVQKQIVIRDFFLTFSINLTDYLGSILSFIALAIPLFSGKYDNLKPADLSMLISQNAFYTIYLINCFTRLIDLAVTISVFLGTMNRVIELNENLDENLHIREAPDDRLGQRGLEVRRDRVGESRTGVAGNELD